jgi:hypothetical protein
LRFTSIAGTTTNNFWRIRSIPGLSRRRQERHVRPVRPKMLFLAELTN